MDSEAVVKTGSESQDSEEPVPPGTLKADSEKTALGISQPGVSSLTAVTPTRFKLKPSIKGVENAKKRLRAFSIQKKTPITPVAVSKGSAVGNTTVLIGKLSSVKVTPKTEDVEQKKLPKPPKPGASRKAIQDSYTDQQKRTQTEIEDMKRKMELVDLGIPLGLICPTSFNDKAMPTKAMPPIKTFLDPAKLDEIISEAKKAKAEGREFKFDYNKVLPDYDNPFQRKKDEIPEKTKSLDDREYYKKGDRDHDWNRKSDRYESDRRHSSYRKYDKEKRKDDKEKRDKSKDKERDDKKEKKQNQPKEEAKKPEKPVKETDVDLNDYLVCDSWSLDNEDKTNSSSPKVDDKNKRLKAKNKDVTEIKAIEKTSDSPIEKPIKIQKLQPVMDSFKFEIDEDEILDMFDENSDLEKFSKIKPKKDGLYDSPDLKLFDFDSTKDSNDALSMTDDTFLESVINEIKQEAMSDDGSQDKGLVEYDSPTREDSNSLKERLSVTPELDDRMRDLQSSRSDYSDGYRSTESGYKSTESGYKSSASYKSGDSRSDSYRLSMEKDLGPGIAKSTVDSLEMWSFVLKICQPLLFRHDRNKCYKETRVAPKLWYTENPKVCSCVKDRSIVYEELEMCKMSLVDRVYGCDQLPDTEFPKARQWYPRFGQCLVENSTGSMPLSSEWEAEDSQSETPTKDQRRPTTPQRSEEIYLDREYQRFMQAVWPEVSDNKPSTPRSTTPVRQDTRKKKKPEGEKEMEDKKKPKKIKLSSEGWSQESDIEEEVEKPKKVKMEKEKPRKRKHSTSLSDSEEDAKKRKKELKKKVSKKAKSKASRIEAKRRRLGKKYLKKLKEKQKKKKKFMKEEESEEDSSERKKKEKKLKKKKLQKKKKAQKKKARAKSSSSSSSSTSSSDSTSSDSEEEKRMKKKKNQVKKKKRKQSTSESQSEDLFDVNILKNIKTERLTDDEKNQKMEFSPRRQKPREIINVKELQNDFVGNNIHIKKEVEEEKEICKEAEKTGEVQSESVENPAEIHGAAENKVEIENVEDSLNTDVVDSKDDIQLKEPQEAQEPPEPHPPTPQLRPDENLSQCSSQESTVDKDQHFYEKDDSHLRPSSQNSNYSFNDVISASQGYHKDEDPQNYEEGNYEMYEQLAMAYQSDVAKQPQSGMGGGSSGGSGCSQRIETVVRARPRGEIKCDWRPGDAPHPAATHRPSRWGLKPGEVNIVLTGGSEQFPIRSVVEPVYQIQSLANRTDNKTMSYDEAYEDMYGASDRLQYGDCFAATTHPNAGRVRQTTLISTSSLDDRINHALKNTVLGEVAKEAEDTDAEKDSGCEKGILVTKALSVNETRGAKRVSFADGYKPGQDSDVEEPPVRKKKKPRRVGCAWPCPASHPDHVPLWDALPPPPPPPGSPPPPHAPPHVPPAAPALPAPAPTQLPPPHVLRQHPLNAPMLPVPPYQMPQKMDPSVSLPNFMPPEPPPGLINFPQTI